MSTRSEAAVRDAENRRARLRQWIDENFGGVQAAFVARHSLNQGEISALLKDKSFGSVKARNLEAKTGMPERYLDAMAGDEVASTPSEPTLPEALELVANALSSVPAEKRQALLGVLTTYASDPTNESDSLKYLQSELQKAQKQPQHIDPATIPTGHPPGGKT